MSPTTLAPYPGLRPFRIDEAHLFFGRDREIVDITGRVAADQRVFLVGPSGSGKSSLINAGLIPQLEGEAAWSPGGGWRVIRLRPGADPLEALARAVEGAVPGVVARDLHQVLRARTTALADLLRQHASGCRVLVIVDQFEEVFRRRALLRSSDGWVDEVEHFVDLLLAASDPAGGPAHLLCGLRGEFVGRCGEIEALASLVNRSLYLLPPLSSAAVSEVVCRPAEAFGARVEPRLVVELQALTEAEDVPLPVLEHALLRAWRSAEARGPVMTLGLDDLQAAGGLSQALGKHADEVLAGVTGAREADRELVGRLFRRLCFIDAAGVRQRNPARVEELATLVVGADAARVEGLLGPFVDAGLLTVDAPTGGWAPETTVDVAHETVFGRWPTLRAWLDQEASDVNLYRQLALSVSLAAGRSVTLLEPVLVRGEALLGRVGALGAWARRLQDPTLGPLAAEVERVLRENRQRVDRDREKRIAEVEDAAERRVRDTERTRLTWLAAFAGILIIGMLGWLVAVQTAKADVQKAAAQASENQKLALMDALAWAAERVDDLRTDQEKLITEVGNLKASLDLAVQVAEEFHSSALTSAQRADRLSELKGRAEADRAAVVKALAAAEKSAKAAEEERQQLEADAKRIRESLSAEARKLAEQLAARTEEATRAEQAAKEAGRLLTQAKTQITDLTEEKKKAEDDLRRLQEQHPKCGAAAESGSPVAADPAPPADAAAGP